MMYPIHAASLSSVLGRQYEQSGDAEAVFSDLLMSIPRNTLRAAVYKAGATIWPATCKKNDLAHFLVFGIAPNGQTNAAAAQSAVTAAIAPRQEPEPEHDLAGAIAAAISGRVKAGVDVDTVREIASETAAQVVAQALDAFKAEGGGSAVTVIRVGETPPVRIEGRQHALFPEILACVTAGVPVFMAGPAGSGKTSIAHAVADALGRPFGMLSCAPGMSEAWILGRGTASGDYLPSEFVTMYEGGGVFLWDEVDNADGQTLNLLNAAMANGRLPLPARTSQPFAKRSPSNVGMPGAEDSDHVSIVLTSEEYEALRAAIAKAEG